MKWNKDLQIKKRIVNAVKDNYDFIPCELIYWQYLDKDKWRISFSDIKTSYGVNSVCYYSVANREDPYLVLKEKRKLI